MPKNGPQWHSMRQGILPKLDQLNSYSELLKMLVRLMMCSDPQKRPSAAEILENFLRKDKTSGFNYEMKEDELIRQ